MQGESKTEVYEEIRIQNPFLPRAPDAPWVVYGHPSIHIGIIRHAYKYGDPLILFFVLRCFPPFFQGKSSQMADNGAPAQGGGGQVNKGYAAYVSFFGLIYAITLIYIIRIDR